MFNSCKFFLTYKNIFILLVFLTHTMCNYNNPKINKLPIVYEDNIYINCVLNNKIHANLMFDTGANEIILDSAFNISSGLGYINNLSFEVKNDFYPPLKVSYDTISYFPKYIQVYNIKKTFGEKCDGIIGWNFFRNYLVKIDYERSYISTFLPNTLTIDSSYIRIPLFFYHEKIFLPLKIYISDSCLINGNFLFDTGYINSVLFSNNIVNRYHLNLLPIKKLTASADHLTIYNTKFTGGVFRGDSIKLGKAIILNPILEYSGQNFEDITITDFGGLIGNRILERFEIIIDFPNKQLFLKPNSRNLTKMVWTTIGFGFRPTSDNPKNYIVTSIFHGTCAEQMGIESGDTIIQINGIKSTDIKPSDLKALINKPRQDIFLVIKRRNKIENFHLLVTEELE